MGLLCQDRQQTGIYWWGPSAISYHHNPLGKGYKNQNKNRGLLRPMAHRCHQAQQKPLKLAWADGHFWCRLAGERRTLLQYEGLKSDMQTGPRWEGKGRVVKSARSGSCSWWAVCSWNSSSLSPFPGLYNGDNTSTYFLGLVRGKRGYVCKALRIAPNTYWALSNYYLENDFIFPHIVLISIKASNMVL